jgi:porin
MFFTTSTERKLSMMRTGSTTRNGSSAFGHQIFWVFLAACLSLMVGMTPLSARAKDTSDTLSDAQPDDETTWSETLQDPSGDLGMDNPGGFEEQFVRDRQKRDYLFQIPGADFILTPWSKLRTRLDEKYGFRPNFSVTNLYQYADKTVGPNGKNEGSGLDVSVDATWTFLGRETESPSMAGFEFLYRTEAGGDVYPTELAREAGLLYPTSVAFSEIDPTIGQLFLRQIFKKKFGFQFGKYNPVPVFDFFPMKNFKTDFVDGVHAANVIIPLPSRGLGAYVMARPVENVYVRVGIHDANADTEKAGFNSLFDEGELFVIYEVGFDPGLAERKPGRPPAGDVHVTFWHQEERDRPGIEDGWGFVVAGSQQFGRFLPFVRYGYGGGGRKGPTPIEHMVNFGAAIDDIFGQSKDRIGVGFTWSRPTNGTLDDQGAVDVYYRVQVTPQIAMSPTVQMVIDPVRNQDEDVVWVLGLRTRFNF